MAELKLGQNIHRKTVPVDESHEESHLRVNMPN